MDIIDIDDDGEPLPPSDFTPSYDAPKPRQFLRLPPAEPKKPRWEERTLPRYVAPEREGTIGRTPPHSIEAEEYLLACCFLDGTDIIAKCIDEKVSTQSFYIPSNIIIFEKMLEMHADKKPIDLALLAEELKGSRQLDGIGGYAHLATISQRMPTTAQSAYFIRKLRELQTLREIITEAGRAVESAFSYKGTEDMDTIKLALDRATYKIQEAEMPVSSLIRSLDSFKYPQNDENCLIGVTGRYLGRGGSLLIPAPAGIGKSTASYQMAACWGTGRDFLGMKPGKAWRVLIVQVEDDEGDVGEMMESIRQGMNFTQECAALLRKNVFIIRDRVNIGDEFHAALHRYVRHTRPDIVIINPLMRYCPGLSKEEIAGPFLSRLDALADEFGFAIVAFHHTPKPPLKDESKGKPMKKEAIDRQYTAFGSSALTNWPRAIINIAGVRGTDGKAYVFQFDKRGGRAGIQVDKAQGAGFRKEFVKELVVQHSNKTITVGGKQYPMVLWEIHPNQNLLKEMEEQEEGEKKPKREPKPEPINTTRKWEDHEVLAMFPFAEANRLPLAQIAKRAESELMMPARVFSTFRFNLMTGNLVHKHEDGKYFKL